MEEQAKAVFKRIFARLNHSGGIQLQFFAHPLIFAAARKRKRFFLLFRKREELDLQLMRREVLQAADVEKVMVEMLLRFRQKIRNIPVKQSPALAVETDQMEIFLALKRATDEALEELADFDGLLVEMEEGTFFPLPLCPRQLRPFRVVVHGFFRRSVFL